MSVTRVDSVASAPSERRAPVTIVVLLLAAIAGIVLLHRMATGWQAASAGGVFPAELRQGMVFALLFNAGLGLVLGLVAAVEALRGAIRLARRRARLPEILRQALPFVLLLVGFVAGHVLLNPWMAQAGRVLRGLLT